MPSKGAIRETYHENCCWAFEDDTGFETKEVKEEINETESAVVKEEKQEKTGETVEVFYEKNEAWGKGYCKWYCCGDW